MLPIRQGSTEVECDCFTDGCVFLHYLLMSFIKAKSTCAFWKKCEKCLFWSGCFGVVWFSAHWLELSGFWIRPQPIPCTRAVRIIHWLLTKSSTSVFIQCWGASNGCKGHLWKTCCCLLKMQGFATKVLPLLYRSKLKDYRQRPSGSRCLVEEVLGIANTLPWCF